MLSALRRDRSLRRWPSLYGNLRKLSRVSSITRDGTQRDLTAIQELEGILVTVQRALILTVQLGVTSESTELRVGINLWSYQLDGTPEMNRIPKA